LIVISEQKLNLHQINTKKNKKFNGIHSETKK